MSGTGSDRRIGQCELTHEDPRVDAVGAHVPSARPVPADIAVGSPSVGWRSVARTGVIVAVLLVIWWGTGLDLMFGAIVAVTALAGVDRAAITWRRACWSLATTAVLVVVGAMVIGRAGIGWPVAERLGQGAAGLAVAAVVWLIGLLVPQRRVSR